MTVVVTGGTGFLGSALLALLARRGDVVALHRPGADPPAVDGVRWVAQDLAVGVGSALPESADAVVHLAQSRRYREFPEGVGDVFGVNAGVTVELLDYARRSGAKTFTYASSGAVYASGPEPVREGDTPRPGNFYAASKLAGELATEQYRALTVALASLGGIVLAGVIAHGAWQARRAGPKRASDSREEPSASAPSSRDGPGLGDDSEPGETPGAGAPGRRLGR